ncbi:MAG TPA: cupin domain-containing protein [Ignavibacteria bacterium]|nr:cupin domain-containing protein [Ignavibacteria bacterium]
MKDADYWVRELELLPHPEGGYFKETYRSDTFISREHLPVGFNGHRNISTSIFYLLAGSQCSKLHRIKSDEMWHFYAGRGLIIYSIDGKGKLTENKLGLDIENGENPQVLIKAGDWFGATVNKPDSYCLAGCTVSPGFHFDEFEMGDRNELLKLFPGHKAIIEKLT